jgi:hypothetical protein
MQSISMVFCLFPVQTVALWWGKTPITQSYCQKQKQTQWSESASELYRRSDRRLSAKWLPTFADRGCHVVSVTDPYGRILGFLERRLFFQVAPQLYSRGWVDPVPDPLRFIKSGSAGNRTRASGTLTTRPQRQSVILPVLKIKQKKPL